MSRRTHKGFSLVLVAALAGAVVSLTPGAADAAEGMPQLNFANPLTLGQAGWMFVIFLLLYLLVKHWGLPQVAAVVEARAASIRADLDRAQQAQRDAHQAVAELTAVTRKAHADAQAGIAEAVGHAKAEAATRATELNQLLDAKLAEAEANIATARGQAMGALRQVAAETTTSLVERLMGTTPDSGMVDQAVGRALAGRQG
jgi:F-type H+-transporting ATPase subunit b